MYDESFSKSCSFFLADKTDGEAFTGDDEEVPALFASQAASAIANARTHRDEPSCHCAQSVEELHKLQAFCPGCIGQSPIQCCHRSRQAHRELEVCGVIRRQSMLARERHDKAFIRTSVDSDRQASQVVEKHVRIRRFDSPAPLVHDQDVAYLEPPWRRHCRVVSR